MTTVDQIKKAIDALPEEEYVLLRQWFSEREWDKWDQQIVDDSASGKLDFLIQEAFTAKAKDKTREL